MTKHKRLDRVIAIKSTTELTRGKTYTVLGVKAYGESKPLLLIATDQKRRRYIAAHLFVPEEIYRTKEEEKIGKELEERGL